MTNRQAEVARVGVAFAGCGKVSELHQLAHASLAGFELCGVFDINRELMAQRAHDWGTVGYDSLDELISDPAVDAVMVLTTAESHLEIASQAVAAGKHVFIEKPVSSDAEGIERLARLAADRGVVVMPGHNCAYVPEYQRLHRLTHNGSLGIVRSVHVNYVIRHSEEIAREYAGILEEVMVHHIYCTTLLLGSPDRIVAGVAEPAWEALAQEDQAWMVWEYEGGRSAHLFATFACNDESNDPWTFVLKVLGTNGTAEMNWRTSFFHRAIGTLDVGIPVYEESFIHASEAFRQALRSGTPPISDLADAALAARLTTAAYESAAEQRFIARVAPGGSTRW